MWQYNHIPSVNELYHYGVKGMKWGVRRTREELDHDRYAILAKLDQRVRGIKTPNGLAITGISRHALDQTQDPTRWVTADEITNALTNPLHITKIKTDRNNRRSMRYIGLSATAVLNPDTGNVITVWKTGHAMRSKYSKEE